VFERSAEVPGPGPRLASFKDIGGSSDSRLANEIIKVLGKSIKALGKSTKVLGKSMKVLRHLGRSWAQQLRQTRGDFQG